jgi:hypothetical protein
MKRIEVSLNLAAVAPLLDFIKPVLETLSAETALETDSSEEDQDLQALWRAGLIQNQVTDCEHLMLLFDAEFFETGRIALTSENADHVLRAASAVRLKLRETAIARITDAELEGGDIEPDALTETERLGFASYLFLATLQEIIIQHTDSG